MKKLLSTLLLGLTLASIFFTSCKKDNYADWEKEQLEKQRIQDSIDNARIKEQFPIIKKYVEDQKLQNVKYVDSLGLAYQILANGDEASYTYAFDGSGRFIIPKITVKYVGNLLDGTVFDKTEADKTVTFGLFDVIPAWRIAFLPKSISFNGRDIPTIGITPTGLKKGSKIRIIAPSPLAYGDQEKKDPSTGKITIPAKSPLDFTIDVVDIKN